MPIARVPAKVNLALSVGGPGSDGYHPLATVFQAVGLFDEIVARPATSAGITLSISGEGEGELPVDEGNLAYRAAALLADHAGIEPAVDLHVHKSIPIAGGMAGGSADDVNDIDDASQGQQSAGGSKRSRGNRSGRGRKVGRKGKGRKVKGR